MFIRGNSSSRRASPIARLLYVRACSICIRELVSEIVGGRIPPLMTGKVMRVPRCEGVTITHARISYIYITYYYIEWMWRIRYWPRSRSFINPTRVLGDTINIILPFQQPYTHTHTLHNIIYIGASDIIMIYGRRRPQPAHLYNNIIYVYVRAYIISCIYVEKSRSSSGNAHTRRNRTMKIPYMLIL